MGRKQTVTQTEMVSAAFMIVREEGREMLTARKLAAKLGCSTQPIFRIYKTMDELFADVYEQIVRFFSTYYKEFPKREQMPFINLGLAYIQFANQEPKLFHELFLSEHRDGRSFYELLNGEHGAVVREINKAKSEGAVNPGELFMKMWIFIHGAACMTLTGDFDLDEQETLRLLKESYQAYIL